VWLHEYISMLHDPAHLMFELTVGTAKDAVMWVCAIYIGRWWVRKHDRENHD
jgi:hypothetical protein